MRTHDTRARKNRVTHATPSAGRDAAGLDSLERLFDAEEVAAALKGKASTVKEKARRREIPFVMFDGSYRWTAAQVRAIIEQHTISAGPAEQKAIEPRRRKARTPETTDAPAVVQLRARPPQRHRRAVGDGLG